MIPYRLVHKKYWTDLHRKLQKLNSDITSATEFVREIEQGNLDVSIGTNASESELKTSLGNMRDRMKKYSLTEKQRNWVNEGLAKFVQILRSANNEGTQSLADNIIRSLVVYLNANQGGLFALNDDNANDPYLELEACYAYDRKKFFEKRIALGEGLAGQVVLEKSTLYLTDVPKDFVKITSGLGEALPRNILLVPLKLDEKVHGVVEIASFQPFESYVIEFVERLGESIASAIAAVKNNERTKTLLKETQLQTEQLKAQEEEVRQNLEELSATQEAMQRAMSEVEGKEAYISQILNASQDLIYTVDREFRMVTWNAMFAREAARLNVNLKKGMNAFEWSPEDRKKLIELYKRVLNGENFELNYDTDVFGKKYYYLSVLAPLKSVTGEIIEAGVYARDVTEMMEAQHESTRLLKEAQQQAEQLKAQEEELRQNMEELSATQEAMERAMKDVEAKETYISQILDTSQDIIYTVDCDFRMATWNASFAAYLELAKVRLERGMNAFEWSPEDRKKLIDLYKRVFNGETFEIPYEITVEGTRYHYLSVYAPIKSATGEVVEAAIYARNVTSIVEAQQESTRLLKEAQHQAAQLKAQEEELRQNMEELSAIQEGMQRAMTEAEAKEAYISQIINTAQDVIYTVDREFRFATWNSALDRAAARINVQIEKGMNAFEWSPADRQNVIVFFNRVFNGETIEHTYEIDLAGKKYHFLSLYAPVKSSSGDIIEAGVYAKDVTAVVEAQREAERLAKETQGREDYLSQLLNASRDVIFSVDHEFKLATWNEAFAKTIAGFGISPHKGMIAFGWRPDGERAHFVELFKRVFKGETFETTAESKYDGKTHQFHSTFTPLKNKEGEIVEALAIARDITNIMNEAKSTSEHNQINLPPESKTIPVEKDHASNGKRQHNRKDAE